MAVDDVLQDGAHRRVVRIGDTVRRPVQPWTPAVHALLRHLQAVAFPYSPRVLGIDEEGREVLTYLEGDSGPEGWGKVVDDTVRDPRIHRPLAELTLEEDGFHRLAPEVQLLYKAKGSRPKDETDFEAVLPLLSDGQRRWLDEALETEHGTHPWHERLRRDP
ncbi:hypothetical protein [Nonomuraea sp. LPB2021202275-12-8]|uniref:hypothetical protein n=1 Tax=Nonomuraea sp. LPB2021202275-12-8 TaxID=3120159 RepID=UPI00300C2ED1